MLQTRRGARRRTILATVVTSTVLAAGIGIGASPASASVSSVSGGAFGYRTFVGIFGGPPALRGPAGSSGCSGTTTTACTPTVTLPSAGSAPITVTDPNGATATYGPAVLHKSVSETVSTQGTTGTSGSAQSSAVVTFPPQDQQNGPVLADGVQSSCTATETAQSGSTTLTDASLIVATDRDTQEPTSIIPIPTNPGPNAEYEGTLNHVGDKFRIIFNEQVRTPDAITVNAFHMFLLGEVAVGEYIVGQSRCAVSATSANQAPVADDDAFSTARDTPLTVAGPGVLGNDSDPTADALTAAKPTGQPVPTNPQLNCTGAGYCAEPVFFPTDAQNGRVFLNADGSFTYTPEPGFVGTDSFTYVASDPRGGTDTAVVSLSVGLQAPVAGDDSYSTVVGVPLHVAAPGVLANDTDPQGEPLSAGSAGDPPNGTVILNADGSFTYVPDPLFIGTDTFTYVLSDPTPNTDTGLVTIAVTAPNLPPTAGDDTYSTNEDTALTVPAPGVLANDSDPLGDPLTAGSASDPANGSVTLNANGSFTYTPDANSAGTDTFTYVVSDGKGGSDTGQVTVAVAALNDAPVAGDDAYTASEDVALTVPAPGVLGNDSDVEGGTLTVGSAGDPANGSAALNADGSFTYAPDANFAGTDTFTYVVSDGTGGNDTGLVTIGVSAVNDAPVAGDDSYTTASGTPLTVGAPGVVVNDTDVDGDPLTAGSASDPLGGSVSLNPNGSLTYNANTGFVGTDTFTYNTSDGHGGSDSAVVTVTVTAPSTTLSVNDVSVNEGNAGPTAAVFTITRAGETAGPSSVKYRTYDGTAKTADGDYAPIAVTTVTFAPGQVSKTVSVAVNGDGAVETNEYFRLVLSSASGAVVSDASGTATIVNDDAPPAVAVNDVSVKEGDAGATTAAVFTLSRTGNTAAASSVRYRTTGGTAGAGTDYTAVPLTTLGFAPGQTTATVSVAVAGDAVAESNETFTLVLSTPTLAVIADGSGTATIVNDDATPYLSVNDVTVTEGSSTSATTPAPFTLTRSGNLAGSSTVQYGTVDGTATAGSSGVGADFTAMAERVVTFAPGQVTVTVTVDVIADTVDEANETFRLALSLPKGVILSDASGTATIVDDEGPVTPGPSTFLAVNDLSVAEGNAGTTSAIFTITRTGDTAASSTVRYQTGAGGTATAGNDYTAVSSTTVTFAAGETTKTVTVAVTGDTVSEADETFNLSLSSPTGAVISDGLGTATIANDDGAGV